MNSIASLSVRGVRWLVLLVLSWGAVSFGAIYPWAYWPLLISCVVTGTLGLVTGSRPLNRSVALGLTTLVAAVLLQLLPLPRSVLAHVSPATDAFLGQYDIAEIAAALPPVASALNIDVHEAGIQPRGHPLTVDAGDTTRGLLFVAALCVFVLGLARALNLKDVCFLIVGLTVLAVALSLVAILQKATSTCMIYGVWQPSDAGTPFGPFANPNHFAGWMVMVLPLCAGLLLARLHAHASPPAMTLRERILWVSSAQTCQIILTGLSLGVMALALVLALSRSGIACFAVVLAVLAWATVRQDRVKFRRNGALAYLGLVAFISIGWVGVDRVASEYLGPYARTEGLGGRKDIWRDTWAVIRDFPLVGTGFNTYRVAMLQYQTPRDFSAVEAHNDYLQLLAEGGLLITVPVAICATIFVGAVRRRFREQGSDQTAYWIRLGAVAGLIGIALQEIVEFSLQKPGNGALFCFLAAVALSDLKREPPLIAGPLGGKSGLGLAIVGGTLVAAIVSGVVAYRVSGPYGESASDHRLNRIYDVQAKRLTELSYDADGNGVFDLWVNLRNPTDIVVERDSNEDGVPESREHFQARQAQNDK